MTPNQQSPDQQMAALVQLANRQRLLQRQAEERTIAEAVRQALKS
jgi:hypothetical protein